MDVTVEDLLRGPAGAWLSPRVVPDSPRRIDQATLLEDVSFSDALRPGAVAVLSRAAERGASGYRFDVLVRDAVAMEVAALVVRASTRRSVTAESLALRGRVALLEVADTADPLQVLDWIGAVVSGDSRADLARLAAAAAFEPDESQPVDAIIEELTRLTGVTLALGSEDLDVTGVGAEIVVDGLASGTVVSTEDSPRATVACRLAAATLSAALTEREHTVMRPVRSASSALGQLLLCSQASLATVAGRAVDAGLAVDGWHCAVRVTVDGASGEPDEAVLAALEQQVAQVIARRGRDPRVSWTVARPDVSVVLVRTTRADPRRRSEPLGRVMVDEVLREVFDRAPDDRFRVGVGTPHDGASGLRISVEEARIALASAQLKDDAVSIATFDALGLRRMLAEWLATDTARDTVRDLLAPLDALGPEKSALAVETLHAYLDERGSLKRAAARLNVHRNAVVYRMGQIADCLPYDLTDADDRFTLQLACRARLMTAKP